MKHLYTNFLKLLDCRGTDADDTVCRTTRNGMGISLTKLKMGLLFIFLALSAISMKVQAQAVEACWDGSNCTSGEFTIESIFLASDVNGTPLTTADCGTPGAIVETFLCVTFSNNTQSARNGIFLSGTIESGGTSVDLAECLPGLLPKGELTTRCIATPYDWTCGDALIFTDGFTGWGASANILCNDPGDCSETVISKCRREGPIVIVTPLVTDFTFEANCLSGETIENITFTSTTTGGVQPYMLYSWDFNGDNIEDVTGNPVNFTYASAGNFDVTLTVTDANNTVDSETKSVLVAVCCSAPDITCPADVTVECDQSTDPSNTGTPTFTEGCGTVTIDFSDSTAAGSCPNESIITRTWTATDEDSNVDTCIQTITVEDTTVPVLDPAPADITVQCIDDVPAPADLAWTDNCDAGGNVTSVDGLLVGDNCGGTITRTWNVSDACGNPALEVTQVITVNDDTDPVFVEALPADATVECDVVPLAPSLTATDNCDANVDVVYGEERIDGIGVDCYTLMRTWTATDECGNDTVHVQTIEVQDTVAPTFYNCPVDVMVACNDDIPAVANVTAFDNCDTDVDVVYNGEVRDNNTCGMDFYTLTRTWTATDNCGNTDVCEQVITVKTKLSDPCFSIELDRDFDPITNTTSFSWEVCSIDPACQDLSNIKFSLPCDVPLSGITNAGSSMSGIIVDVAGRPQQCSRYAIGFENFGDGGIKGEAGGCATFFYTLTGDQSNYDTDVSIKAGREKNLGFDNVGAECDCDESFVANKGASTIKSAEVVIDAEVDAIETEEPIDVTTVDAYPLPFGNELNLQIEIAYEAIVRVQLFDMDGRLVLNLGDHPVTLGTNTLEFRIDGRIPEAILILKVDTGKEIISKTVLSRK